MSTPEAIRRRCLRCRHGDGDRTGGQPGLRQCPTAQVSAVATSTQAISLATSTSTSSPNILSPEVTPLSAAETFRSHARPVPLDGLREPAEHLAGLGRLLPRPDLLGSLRPNKGVYDFKWIEDGLKKAGETKGKFGFRVMAYCPLVLDDHANRQGLLPGGDAVVHPARPGDRGP